jgi:hypothetical protein
MIFVVADTKEPWVLNLEGYRSLGAAKQAVRWQQRFNDTKWRIAELRDGRLIDVETSALITPSRGPYTQETWWAFIKRTGL